MVPFCFDLWPAIEIERERENKKERVYVLDYKTRHGELHYIVLVGFPPVLRAAPGQAEGGPVRGGEAQQVRGQQPALPPELVAKKYVNDIID